MEKTHRAQVVQREGLGHVVYHGLHSYHLKWSQVLTDCSITRTPELTKTTTATKNINLKVSIQIWPMSVARRPGKRPLQQ